MREFTLAPFWCAPVYPTRPTLSATTDSGGGMVMSASPQRLSYVTRPITNASVFFAREMLAPKMDSRRARRVGGFIMPWHKVVCQVATGSVGVPWTCVYSNEFALAPFWCAPVYPTRPTLSATTAGGGGMVMSASPQRLSDTTRPITNASVFFCARNVGAKDG